MALTEMVIMPGADYQDACDALREKTGGTEAIKSGDMGAQIRAIQTGVELPELTNPAAAEQILDGYEAVDQNGEKITGSIPVRSADDATVSGKTVQIPNGYYEEPVSVDVATVERGAPSIDVSDGGLISASVNQEEGYVDAGTNTKGYQLTTQAAKTITPGTSDQTAVASGRYTTGDIIVAGDANLVAENIKSGVSIFDVSGSLSGATLQGGSVANQLAITNGVKGIIEALDNPNVTYTNDSAVNIVISIPNYSRVCSLYFRLRGTVSDGSEADGYVFLMAPIPMSDDVTWGASYIARYANFGLGGSGNLTYSYTDSSITLKMTTAAVAKMLFPTTDTAEIFGDVFYIPT